MASPLRCAVLGAGRIGQVHARAIAAGSGTELVAVSDPDFEATQRTVSAHGGEVRALDDVWAADDVDAVIICTPTDTHADLIERSAEAGKAIFCEKPIDLDINRVRRCLDTVARHQVPLMVGFQRRFDPDFQALKAELDAGRIGEVEIVSLISRDPSPPPPSYIERSGGILKDMTIHDFDMARWLLGEEVERVVAVASVLTDPQIGALGDHDTVNLIVTTRSGRQATIGNSRRASYGYDQRIEVHGSKGALRALNHSRAKIELATVDGVSVPPLQDFFMTRYAAAYSAEISAFADAVASGRAPPVTGHDGLMALMLAEAAATSVREGRAVAVSELAD